MLISIDLPHRSRVGSPNRRTRPEIRAPVGLMALIRPQTFVIDVRFNGGGLGPIG